MATYYCMVPQGSFSKEFGTALFQKSPTKIELSCNVLLHGLSRDLFQKSPTKIELSCGHDLAN